MSLGYSGFLSPFTFTNVPIAGDADLMSTVVSTNKGWSSTSASGSYTGGRMYLGRLLVQFTIAPFNGATTLALPTSVGSGTGTTITVNYPATFSSAPYFVLATAEGTSGSNFTVTVLDSSPTSFTFVTGNNPGSIQYLAIGPK